VMRRPNNRKLRAACVYAALVATGVLAGGSLAISWALTALYGDQAVVGNDGRPLELTSRAAKASPPLRKAVVDANSYSEKTGRQDRVYCMVPTIYSEEATKRWEAIMDSWGRRCDVLKFFVDSVEGVGLPEKFHGASVVQVKMKRKADTICSDGKPCRHIWEKVWRSWAYVYMNDLREAEWFLKIDDDTYFIPSNLRRYVRENDMHSHEPHYFGFNVAIEKRPFTLISGVCTAFSRQSINLLGPRLLSMGHEYGARQKFPNSHGKCVDRDGATEERVTSVCLADVGVFARETLEDGQREFVIPLGIPFTLTYVRKENSTSWYWFNKPWTRGDRRNCCSNKAWGFHGYKSSSRLLEMEGYMFKMSEKELKAARDSKKPGKNEWSLYDYVLDLRRKIKEDPFAY